MMTIATPLTLSLLTGMTANIHVETGVLKTSIDGAEKDHWNARLPSQPNDSTQSAIFSGKVRVLT